MYDIYAVTPNPDGSLKKVLVAGKYLEWGVIVYVTQLLFKIAIRTSLPVFPTFEVQNCHHRVTSNHYRTYITHTQPTDEEILIDLLLGGNNGA